MTTGNKITIGLVAAASICAAVAGAMNFQACAGVTSIDHPSPGKWCIQLNLKQQLGGDPSICFDTEAQALAARAQIASTGAPAPSVFGAAIVQDAGP